MAAALPLDVRLVFTLPPLGINPDHIGFKNLSMQSDSTICVREEGQVVIVDTASGAVSSRMPMTAEAAIMNPDGKNIAVRAGQNIQIWNLELQRKVKSHKLPEGQVCQFWTWISGNTIALVTTASCYHWSLDGDAAPAKMFDRDASLTGTQVINYAASADGKWLMVVGIKGGASGVEGAMQLYSVEKKVSQALQSHAACFATAKVGGRSDTAMLFCFVEKKPGANSRLFIMEVGKDKSAPGGVFRLAPQEMPVPEEAKAADFPVSLQVSKKHDILYVVTKMGYVYLYDVHTGNVLFRHKITDQPVFTTTVHKATNGVLAITAKSGQVILATINEGNLVPYIVGTLRNNALAMTLATRLNLPGADELYVKQFEELLGAGNVEGAAKLAAASPGTVLRNHATIKRFQAMPQAEGQQPPVLKYFSTLMERGRLNNIESVEIARPALQQGRGHLLEKWLSEDKVTCSEELGDMVAPFDARLALQVYLKSGEAHEKVVNCYMSTGEYDKIVPYATKFGYAPNYIFLLQNLVHSNPAAAQEMALQLYKNESGPLVEIPAVVETFMQFNRLQETTSFLLDVLAGDSEDQGFLQTKLLEMNLLGGAPQVADAILQRDMFHHFDRHHIAGLCENAQLYARALELYTELSDIKKVLLNTHAIKGEFLEAYFGTMTPENCLECLDHLLTNNMGANLQIVVKVATKYTEQLEPEALIALFEKHSSFDGLFYYLGSIVNVSESPAVHFKYIVAAAKLNQFKEVERVCRDSTVYNAEEVKEFLLDAKLPDPRPLIHVCDRHGYVGELTAYLYNNGLKKFIEVYVQKVSAVNTPTVVGKLLDLDCDEEFIKNLLNSVRHACPVDPLVEQVEQRNRLRLLQPWLEQRVAEGNTEPATHNAIGKIYIVLNKDPQQFLKNNTFYDSKVVGKFCEKLDPYLAFLAYRRAADGSCDDELIAVTNKNGLFKDQARFLVERQDEALWAKVLAEDNPHRAALIEQVSGTALPEIQDPDLVSSTVRAFMEADLPNELLSLLEKLVLQGTDFKDNKNLQNLLILTAIKCSNREDAVEGRAMEYIQRLDNFDGPEIAKIAVRDDYKLYDEAFAIYTKFDDNVEAVEVLLDLKHDLDRAFTFAERCDNAEVWSKLARAQLDAGQVTASIDAYIKAADPSLYQDVVRVARGEGKFNDLVRYLEMARKKLKERFIDTEMVYALAQTKRLGDLEVFITSPNVADIQAVGDRCFDESLFEAAKVLYTSAGNNAKLAVCLIRLKMYREAVDAARKANSMRTWKEVNAACVEAHEFRLAQICGLSIIVSPDDLEELIEHYERFGHFEELIKLMEQGLGLESAHQGIFTELGVLYSKYNPDKLMEHIKFFWSRVNVSKLLRACENGQHWKEAAFLYVENKEYDQAVRVMIEHSPDAFQADRFMDIIQKVRNQELYYRAITFYLEEEPMQLNKLLSVLMSKLDHPRVVHQLRRGENNLPLVLDYLKAVQKENLSAVNEALNELYVEEEDFEALRASIEEFDKFDQIQLAQRVEHHELLEFRRIAALLYKRNKRWDTSIGLSKKDKMFKDAIDTCADSRSTDLAEGLLKFFVEEGEKECFCATLYTCYDLIRPDVALEMAWRNRLMDFAMPYLIQYVREVDSKLREIDERTRAEDSKAEEEAARAAEAAAYGGGFGGVPMLAQTAYNPAMDPSMGGMGMGGMPQGGMYQGY